MPGASSSEEKKMSLKRRTQNSSLKRKTSFNSILNVSSTQRPRHSEMCFHFTKLCKKGPEGPLIRFLAEQGPSTSFRTALVPKCPSVSLASPRALKSFMRLQIFKLKR